VVRVFAISIVAFSLAYIFGIGGLGSAVALIPVLVFLGIPFEVARTAGLFVNFLTTASITAHNVKNRAIKYDIAVPIMVSSVIAAPIGAWASLVIPERVVGLAFVAFLFFAGTMALIRRGKGESRDIGMSIPIAVGTLSGFISGLLGVGGGGIISPILITYGLDPKVVAPLTAFCVQFSSLTSFLTYWRLSAIDWSVVLSASLPSVIARYLAGKTSHRLRSDTIRKILALIFYVIGVKFAMRYM